MQLQTMQHMAAFGRKISNVTVSFFCVCCPFGTKTLMAFHNFLNIEVIIGIESLYTKIIEKGVGVVMV